MKKKILIAISLLVTIVITAIILVIVNNAFAPKKETNDIIYKDPTIKTLKLKSISTKDKQVVIDDTIAYFTPDNGISQINLEINSKNTLDELFLLIEFELENKTENIIVYQKDIESNEKFNYMIQSLEDLTTTKSWKVSKINESEAIQKGFIKTED